MDTYGDREKDHRDLKLGQVGYDGNLLMQLERFQLPAENQAARNARVLKSFALDIAGPCTVFSVFCRSGAPAAHTFAFHAIAPDASSVPDREAEGAAVGDELEAIRLRNRVSGATPFAMVGTTAIVSGIVLYPVWGPWRNHFPESRKIAIVVKGAAAGNQVATQLEVGLGIISNLS